MGRDRNLEKISPGRKLLLLTLPTALLGGLVLELGFGNWFSQNLMDRLHLIRSGSFRFDVSELYDNGGEPVVYERDAFGFRGRYRAPGEIDILTVGGSTTDQRFITEGKTWQDVLASAFREGGVRVSVVNAGVDGQSSVGHIKNFDWWFPHVPSLNANYYLFYVGLNDFHVEDVSDYDQLVDERSFNAFNQRAKRVLSPCGRPCVASTSPRWLPRRGIADWVSRPSTGGASRRPGTTSS